MASTVIGSRTSWTWPTPASAKARNASVPASRRRGIGSGCGSRLVAGGSSHGAGKGDQQRQRALDLAGVASDGQARGIDAVAQLQVAGEVVAELREPGVPGIRVRHRDLEHPRARRPDQQRRATGAGRRRNARQVADLVEAAVEVGAALAQQAPDDGEGLLEPAHPLVVREAKRPVLVLVPAGAEAEDQAPAADLVDRRGLGGQHRRVVEAGRRHQRADLDAARDRRPAPRAASTPPTGRPAAVRDRDTAGGRRPRPSRGRCAPPPRPWRESPASARRARPRGAGSPP